MLQCKNLILGYSGRPLIRNLSFEINKGECWAIIGKNGSGKTTLLHALAGLIPEAAGKVEFRGKSINAYKRRSLATHIGLLLQNEDRNYWGSVAEYISLGRYPHADSLWSEWLMSTEASRTVLEKMGLRSLATRPINTLSGGEWQRARIALLLLQQPKVYLLDEPLQHLDLKYQQETLTFLYDLAKKERKAVAMVVHDLAWLPRYCDHALLLYDDRDPLFGPISEVLNLENLERLFQCSLRVAKSETGEIFLPC